MFKKFDIFVWLEGFGDELSGDEIVFGYGGEFL